MDKFYGSIKNKKKIDTNVLTKLNYLLPHSRKIIRLDFD